MKDLICGLRVLSICVLLGIFVFFMTKSGAQLLEDYFFLSFCAWMLSAGSVVVITTHCNDTYAAHGEIRAPFRALRNEKSK